MSKCSVLGSLTTDITPTGVLLVTLNVSGELIFFGLVSEPVKISWNLSCGLTMLELVHTQGGQCHNQIGAKFLGGHLRRARHRSTSNWNVSVCSST